MYGFGGVGLSEVQLSISELSVVGGGGGWWWWTAFQLLEYQWSEGKFDTLG